MLKIQFLNGGLANQAFQYIFARYYELSHPGEIMYMDDSYFALNTVHNGYELEKVFGIKPHMLSSLFDEDVWEYMLSEKKNGKSIPQIIYDNGEDIRMLSEIVGYESFNPFDGEVLLPRVCGYDPRLQELAGNVYYHGYWINNGWFERYQDIFLKEFSFPQIQDDKNRRLLNDIITGNSLSVHVRRGDYVSINKAFGADTYREFIDCYIREFSNDWVLYIFSDDIGWCKENSEELGFNLFRKAVYVEGNIDGKNYIDLQLMSKCKAMITSNSAFGYLAALLNTNKIACLHPTDREV